jgi:chloramphenicol O-acetyltransferase type A
VSQLFDIDSWERKEHFQFFKDFEEPFFGLTFNADVTGLYTYVNKENFSFFTAYLHAALTAANDIMEFRLRIRPDDTLVLHNSIGASPTVYRPDGTFGFAHINYRSDFLEFAHHLKRETEKVKAAKGLVSQEKDDNTIHISALPWIKFTSISHARNFKYKESIPKISFGKMFDDGTQKLMPVSVHVNHAVMDGYHISMFIEKFQQQLNQELVKKKKV